MTASNIQYEVAQRTQAISCGGIGAIHLLVRELGLIEAIDQRLRLLLVHMPYHESDHVLNFAYNALCGGHCMQDMELRRNDVNFLNALGATRTPDPTTAGDFCRRFNQSHVETLQDVFNDARQKVWAKQPQSFFDCAILDADGTLVGTNGQCKHGADFAYDGTYGYHPLVVSLANTGEILRIRNRSGNRPSHEHAAEELDRALSVCWQAGFRAALLRGDTDFSQTKHLDGWNANPRIRFIFGYDAVATLVDRANNLPPSTWRRLVRPEPHEVKTQPRTRPTNVKDQTVRERKYERLRLVSEDVGEFDYQPSACTHPYRMVVVRKNISKEKGDKVLDTEVRHLFYITNERELTAEQIVASANDRCNQENLIAQLKGGVRALKAPVDTLLSNWAYMVMVALAWSLKAWWALMLEEKPGRYQDRHREEKRWVLRLEFRTFLNVFVLLPCQIIRTGRKLTYRLLGWNPHLSIFFRFLKCLRC